MEIRSCRLIKLFVLSLLVFPAVFSPVSAQMVTPCTISMFNGFIACVSYVLGVGAGGRSPSTDCCADLSSMVNSSSGCLCLIMSANPSLQVLIDQALAVVFPQACAMPPSTVQCQDNSFSFYSPASAFPRPATAPNPSSTMPPVATTDASAPAPAVATAASAPAPAAAAPAPIEVAPPPALPSPTTLGSGVQRTMPNSAQKIHGFSSLFLLAMLVLEGMHL